MFNKKRNSYKNLIYTLSALALSSFVVSEAWAKKLTLTMNEDDSLPVKVAKNGSVRISVKGDRLQDVMGLEESVSFEKDEVHGFLYLRGIDRKQTITIITEGGTLQDLTLEPDDHGVSNVVLKSKDYIEEDKSYQKTSFEKSSTPSSFNQLHQTALPNSTFQDAVILAMKQLHIGMGGCEDIESIASRQTAYHLSATPLRQIKAQGILGVVFEIINDTGSTQNLLEKDFYRIGDFALAIGKKQLEAGEKTFLIVVSRG